MRVKNIADIFPILTVETDGLIITKNADLCIAFAVDYPEVFLQNENSYSLAFETLIQAVKNLGEGFLVHKQDFFFEDKYEADTSHNESGDFVINQNELNFQDRAFVNHKGFIYITLPSSNPLKRDSLSSGIFKKYLIPKELLNPKTKQGFLEKAKAFQNAVNGSKIFKLNRLNREQIVGSKNRSGLFDYYFTLGFQDSNLYDICSRDGVLNVGNKELYTFVINDLDQYPSELPHVVSFNDYSTDRTVMPASYGLAFGLNLPINHIYNQVLYIPKQSELSNDLISETRKHFSFSQWSRDNTFSMEQKTRFVDTIKTGGVAIKAHFNIQVFDRSRKRLDSYKDMVSAAIQNTGFISKVATTYSEQLYWSCIPGNACELGYDNFATTLLDNGIALWNLESNYKTSPYQNNGILLTDRFGTPRIVDIFFEPLKKNLINNRNFTVIGPSGSGKSFTMNNMVYYLLNSGAHITIVDIGHSYRRIGEILNAKYIEHSDERPISLNPFYFELEEDLKFNVETVNELKEEFKQVITQIIFLLYKKDGETINKSEEVTIFFMVTEYYNALERKNKGLGKHQKEYIRPCFNTFYDFIKADFPEIFKKAGGRAGKEFDLENFYYVLTPFYEGGQYGYLLNGTEDLDLSKHPFVIYELDNIKDHPILLPIITLMITNTYVAKLFGVRGKLKMLIIEEAWRAVSSDFFANFLLWAFKTARKHLGSIGVVTQEIEDLLKSQIIKDAIVQNTDIKLILDIRKYLQQSEEVLKLFKINESNIPQIFSINRPIPSERGQYKEMAVVLGDECKVYGVEVSKYAYALFTTEATEVDQIKELAEKKDIPLKEAAIMWAKEFQT
jgi:conjugation system TraG family ATPase